MIAVVLLSGLLGWFGMKMRQAERQRKAVEAIRKAGGWVYYDYQMHESGIDVIADAEPPAPAWLRRLLGEDFFSDAVDVSFYDVFSSVNTGDADLEHLKGQTKLFSLIRNDTQVTKIGIWKLQRDLPNCQIIQNSGGRPPSTMPKDQL